MALLHYFISQLIPTAPSSDIDSVCNILEVKHLSLRVEEVLPYVFISSSSAASSRKRGRGSTPPQSTARIDEQLRHGGYTERVGNCSGRRIVCGLHNHNHRYCCRNLLLHQPLLRAFSIIRPAGLRHISSRDNWRGQAGFQVHHETHRSSLQLKLPPSSRPQHQLSGWNSGTV